MLVSMKFLAFGSGLLVNPVPTPCEADAVGSVTILMDTPFTAAGRAGGRDVFDIL